MQPKPRPMSTCSRPVAGKGKAGAKAGFDGKWKSAANNWVYQIVGSSFKVVKGKDGKEGASGAFMDNGDQTCSMDLGPAGVLDGMLTADGKLTWSNNQTR